MPSEDLLEFWSYLASKWIILDTLCEVTKINRRKEEVEFTDDFRLL